jgi:hypothetical protein
LPAPIAFAPPPVAPPPGAPASGIAGGAAAGAGAGAVKVAVTALAAASVAGIVVVGAVVGLGVGRSRLPHPSVSGRPAAVEKLERRVPEPLENEEDIPIAEVAPAGPSAPVAAPAARHRHAARPTPAAPIADDVPVAPPPVPSDAASRLREEAALVQRAERLLASDPSGALRLTEERRRRFPRGALDQEAEVVAIDALLRLGRRSEATTRAGTFEAAHAGSLHARRIRRLLGD